MKMVSPKSTIEMEYDVKGQLFIIPLQSRGYFSGNYCELRYKLEFLQLRSN